MAKHDGRTAAKKQAFHDMYNDDITLCKYDMLGTDVLIHVILNESNVIGINIDDRINILIDIFSY
jgi:hypothetical protein